MPATPSTVPLPQARTKDRADADVTLPLLDPDARDWLCTSVAAMDPHLPWVLG